METPQSLGGTMSVNEEMICQHCQQKGSVSVSRIKAKTGMSTFKILLAFITAGISILFMGLARKESRNKATCLNCKTNWVF